MHAKIVYSGRISGLNGAKLYAVFAAAIEYDAEFMADALVLLEPPEKDIHHLLAQAKSGENCFGGQDPPLVTRLKKR